MLTSKCQLFECSLCLLVSKTLQHIPFESFHYIPSDLCFLLAALAVLLDFILQVTAFVALIVFDFKRTEDKRVDCFPCIKKPQSSYSSDKGTIIFGGLIYQCRLL